MPAKRALIMHPDDNVATAVEEIAPGEEVRIPVGADSRALTAAEAIPFGFKLALADIPKDAAIVKYGETIGKAGAAIPKGSLVHIHNLEGTRARGDLVGR
jgi:altronate dehydratase small subunit